jgi:hypothetical protein
METSYLPGVGTTHGSAVLNPIEQMDKVRPYELP